MDTVPTNNLSDKYRKSTAQKQFFNVHLHKQMGLTRTKSALYKVGKEQVKSEQIPCRRAKRNNLYNVTPFIWGSYDNIVLYNRFWQNCRPACFALPTWQMTPKIQKITQKSTVRDESCV